LNYEQYKEQFLRERFVLLEKLDEKEIDSIPKSTKSVEYAYLNEKGIINNDGVYY